MNSSNIEKKWLLVDASNISLGRLAAHVAYLIRGKNKPYFTPHVDCGDNVIYYLRNNEDRDEAEKLFAAYDECLKTVLSFADGQSQILLAATIKQEVVTDCRIVEEDEEDTGEESKKEEDVGEDKNRKKGEEKGGDEDKEDEN